MNWYRFSFQSAMGQTRSFFCCKVLPTNSGIISDKLYRSRLGLVEIHQSNICISALKVQDFSSSLLLLIWNMRWLFLCHLSDLDWQHFVILLTHSTARGSFLVFTGNFSWICLCRFFSSFSNLKCRSKEHQSVIYDVVVVMFTSPDILSFLDSECECQRFYRRSGK